VIEHLKADHRTDRCHLRGEIGDRLHVVLCAAGYNVRWLLRATARRGLKASLRLLPAGLAAALARAVEQMGACVGASFTAKFGAVA
jgi:hypothetical protein